MQNLHETEYKPLASAVVNKSIQTSHVYECKRIDEIWNLEKNAKILAD